MLRNRRMHIFFQALVVFSAFAALLIHPELASAAAVDALRLCGTVILPALFPFFVCTNLMTSLGLSRIPAKILRPVMKPLFRVGEQGAAALALGMLGGYPSGAQVAVRLYLNGSICRADAQQLLMFCNNAGPAFIVGVVGAGVFGDSRVGVLLYAVHIASAVVTGILLRQKKPYKNVSTPSSARFDAPPTFAAAFTAGIRQACETSLQVAACVVFFGVLCAFLQSVLPASVPPFLRVLLCGMLEMSTGTAQLRGSAIPASLAPAMASFLLGFGGLSVYAQTLSILSGTDLSAKLLAPKLLQGAIAAAMTILLCKILPVAETALPTALFCVPDAYLTLNFIRWTAAGTFCLILRKLTSSNCAQKRV